MFFEQPGWSNKPMREKSTTPEPAKSRPSPTFHKWKRSSFGRCSGFKFQVIIIQKRYGWCCGPGPATMQSSCPQGLMVNLFHWIAGSPCYTKAAHQISVRATYCVVAPVQVSHKRLVLEITFGSNDACVPANTIHFNPSSVEEVQIIHH